MTTIRTASTQGSIDDRVDVYARLGIFSTSGIGGAMGCAIRGGIVRKYVHAYLCEHGRFPFGLHTVSGTYGKATIRFDVRFPGRASAALAASGRRFAREDLWGLHPQSQEGAFRRARQDYRQSTERNRLRAWLLLQVEEALNFDNNRNGEGT